MEPTMEKRIDALFTRWQQGVCPGGQVAIRRKGELIYDKCFGYANVENELPVTDQSVFHVASVSKQLTVFAVLLLHEDGKLNVDDDIRQYVGDLVRFAQPVTIRNLFNNVSGIRDIWTLEMMRGVRIDDTITMQDAVSIIGRQNALNFEPENEYMYSNSNFVLLAVIVERVAGMTLNDFLKQRVFDPLGMHSTCVRQTYWQRIDHRAQSYHDNGSEFLHAVLNFGTYGATSLHTTAKDYLKWMRNYHEPVLCKPETLSLMMTVPTLQSGNPTDYAGGLRVGELGGHRYIQHSGVDAAFRASMMHIFDEDIDIVIFANTQNTLPPTASFRIARMLLGVEEPVLPDPPAYYTENFDEADAAGYYYDDLPMCVGVDVFRHKGQLCMREWFEPAPLTHIKGNMYRVGHLDNYLYLGEKAAYVVEGEVQLLHKANAAPRPAAHLTCFAGKYVSEELLTEYDVVYEDGALYLSHFRGGKHRLYPMRRDTFIGGAPLTLIVQFTRGSNNEVIGLTFSAPRIQHLAFSKVQ